MNMVNVVQKVNWMLNKLISKISLYVIIMFTIVQWKVGEDATQMYLSVMHVYALAVCVVVLAVILINGLFKEDVKKAMDMQREVDRQEHEKQAIIKGLMNVEEYNRGR